MATYLIGDVQGCYQPLMQLLDQINFDEHNDNLGFTGDLVNRGPDSLKTLRFVHQLPNAFTVLGNHDLHLLMEAEGLSSTSTAAYQDLFNAADKTELLTWLRHQPLLYRDNELNYCLVHAGIPPQWSIEQALEFADEVSEVLHGDNFADFLEVMFGNHPDTWDENLTGNDRLRYIVNALTRMRFCNQYGKLELTNKTAHTDQPDLKPWFEWRNDNTDIVFGHWASLMGQCNRAHAFAIDTGCVWGNSLTALRVEDKKLFSHLCT